MKNLTTICIKLLSIYFIVLGLGNIVNVIPAFLISFSNIDNGNLGLINITFILSPLFFILLGLILWLASNHITTAILKNSEETVVWNINERDIQLLFYSFVGIVLIAYSIPSLISAIYSLNAVSRFIGSSNNSQQIKFYATIIENIIKIIIGLWLSLGSKSIVNIFKKLRNAGTNNIDIKIKDDDLK